MSEKRRALGRGLGALIPSAPHPARPADVFFRDAEVPTGHGGAERGSGALSNERDPASLRDDAARRGKQDGAHSTGADEPASNGVASVETTVGVSGRPGDAQHGLAPVPGAEFAELPVSSIRPNPRQPRTTFDEDDLAELAHSIREIGVLQPIVVRRVRDDDGTQPTKDKQHQASTEDAEGIEGTEGAAGAEGAAEDTPDAPTAAFELIMGERRLRASQLAGLDTIPAIIKETQDDALLRDALLENLHRSQLNPLEEAAAYQQLLDDFGCSHEELASRIGRSRPQISNTLRLLRLPPLVARRLAAGVLSAGHARALLGLEDGAAMERLAQRIVAEGLSVRSVEEIVALGGDQAPRARRLRAGTRHPQLDDLSARLSDRFDTRVFIALGQRKGKITVEFASVEDLNRIVALLGERVEASAHDEQARSQAY